MRQLLRLTPSKRDDAANILAAHEEIRGTIELKTIGGAVGKDDAAMLGGVLDLRGLRVLDIMVHRTKMQTINIAEPPPKVIDEITQSQYTRVPLWRDEPENIVGVLHTKDLLVALARSGWDVTKIDIAGAAAPPWLASHEPIQQSEANPYEFESVYLILTRPELAMSSFQLAISV